MPLGKMCPLLVVAALAALLLALSAGAQARQAQPAPGTCQGCHDAGLPLPEGHARTKGVGITECAACHASQAGQAKPYPLAVRLHRAHTQAGVECTTCHAYSPGRNFSVPGRKGNLGALDAEQYDMVRDAMRSWADSPWLAATHGNRQNLSCGACHGKQLIPDDNETVVNKQCVACHGNYDKLAALTKARLENPELNPHGSHLGPEIACTVCHQGHRESKPYCLNCHTNFKMPIPGGAARAAVPAAGK